MWGVWQRVHKGLSAKKASRSAREWTAFPLWRVWQALQDHCTCEGAPKSAFWWAAVFLSKVRQAVQNKGVPPSQQACLQIFLSRARLWEKLGGFAPERTNASSPASCMIWSSTGSFCFSGEKRDSLNKTFTFVKKLFLRVWKKLHNNNKNKSLSCLKWEVVLKDVDFYHGS